MITVRKSDERGRTRLDWLDSRHTFSFGEYHDPDHMGFGPLRVINEDRVEPGAGFGMHPHQDMEIVTYVLEGALQHRDTLGTGSVIRPGDVQRMTAGTGILHSEENASRQEPVHFLQIWILPERAGWKPEYEQLSLDAAALPGRLIRVTLAIHQDVDLYAARLAPGQEVAHSLRPGREAWLQVARGELSLNGVRLESGDGASAREESALAIRCEGREEAELLLFDLP